MTLDVSEFHVNLVEYNLFTAFLVNNGVDSASKHKVCSDFHAGVLKRFVGNIALLVGKFVTESR